MDQISNSLRSNHIDLRRTLISGSRIAVLAVAGAAPVLSIPIHAMRLAKIHDTAIFFVVPIAVVTAVLFFTGTAEGRWALRGFIAGLLAVAAYDAVRIPLVLAGIWPDFIPKLGGWITGSEDPNYLVGYLWRILGDGGGMGMVFFLACAVVGITEGTKIAKNVVPLGVGYGIFIWSGLIATVTLVKNGSTMLFQLNPTNFLLSLLGHLIYGSVLGYCYRWVIHRKASG